MCVCVCVCVRFFVCLWVFVCLSCVVVWCGVSVCLRVCGVVWCRVVSCHVVLCVSQHAMHVVSGCSSTSASLHGMAGVQPRSTSLRQETKKGRPQSKSINCNELERKLSAELKSLGMWAVMTDCNCCSAIPKVTWSLVRQAKDMSCLPHVVQLLSTSFTSEPSEPRSFMPFNNLHGSPGPQAVPP